MRAPWHRLLVILALLAVAGARLEAAPGDLDASFGSGGIATLGFPGAQDHALAVLVQPDGKIVVGGGGPPTFTLARYDASGALDPGFGSGGTVALQVAGLSQVAAVALQTDGDIVAVGPAGFGGFAVARYTPAGALDTAGFNTPLGWTSTAMGSRLDVATAGAIQPDGKIVAAGYTFDTVNGTYDIALVRYTTSGGRDPSFGTGGIVTTDLAGRDDEAFGVTLQPDGKIVAVGFTSNGSDDDFALVRYDSSGALDPSFGSGGRVMTPIGSRDDQAFGVVLQPDGKLVVVGQSFGFDLLDVALARYDPDGSLDATFGNGGRVVTALSGGHDAAHAVVRQSDGKLVVAGYATVAGATRMALVRYDGAGNLDPSFGTAGTVTTAINGRVDEAKAIALQSDGKIVAVGRTAVPFTGSFGGHGFQDDMAILRYLP